MSEPKLLHVHAQGAHHDDVCIVGNRAGLKALQSAIEGATKTGARMDRIGQAEVMVADGEGYTVRVILDNSPFSGPTWVERAVPYTDDCARETGEDAIWP